MSRDFEKVVIDQICVGFVWSSHFWPSESMVF